MENKGYSHEMTGDQRRIFVDATQLHHAYREVAAKSRGYRGGMHWKKVKGRDYLFRSRIALAMEKVSVSGRPRQSWSTGSSMKTKRTFSKT